MHKGSRNRGLSRMAILGDCEGGALKLADGRMFRKKRQWYQYNGALVEHGVMPFKGGRLSVVLFQLPEATPVLALGGEVPRPLNTEAADPTLLHPKVPVYEDPAEQQRREQVLKAAAEKARHEWRQTAAQKAWNTIKAGLDVYRHAGETLTEDPRRQP